MPAWQVGLIAVALILVLFVALSAIAIACARCESPTDDEGAVSPASSETNEVSHGWPWDGIDRTTLLIAVLFLASFLAASANDPCRPDAANPCSEISR